MRLFSLEQDLWLDTRQFCRRYLGTGDPAAVPADRLYLAVGEEVRLIWEKLKAQHAQQHPALDGAVLQSLAPQALGLRIAHEDALLAEPLFPARLGRVSSRMAGTGLHMHPEAQPLPAQLQALRASKPGKARFRFAIVSGFGLNLGDSLMGITAFRVVLQYLRRHFPTIGCDVLLGQGVSTATADILGHEEGIERVFFQALTAAEFAQYDGYFDFTDLTQLPRYDELPAVDWVLWWCGLDAQAVPEAQKRNRGAIRWDAWNTVRQHLRDRAGPKVLFNPKASAALRTMPAEVAADFAGQLLALAPDITLVIDQPLALRHARLMDLSGHIDTPEKFKALVGQMDGVVTVNSLASHVADLCAIPTVHLCVCVPGSIYPYYPFMAALNPEGYEALPAFRKVKVEENEWPRMQGAYAAAWARIAPAQVLALLREKMAQRQSAAGEPAGLALAGERAPASCLEHTGIVAWPKHQRLAPEHAHASERLAHLTRDLLKPGAVCVMACAPEPSLVTTLAQRVLPHGEMIVLEPRTLLAQGLQSSLYLAGAFATRVLPVMAGAEAGRARLHALDPWSESHSGTWGNAPQEIEVPRQTVDALALERCDCLIVQSPLPGAPFIMGALQTLGRCRPLFFMAPVSHEEAAALCRAAQAADYDFWAEVALPGQDAGARPTLLLVGTPKEKQVRMDGFLKVTWE